MHLNSLLLLTVDLTLSVDISLKIIERSQLKIIEDAGHMVMMEQPEQVNKCLCDFLFTSQHMSEVRQQ